MLTHTFLLGDPKRSEWPGRPIGITGEYHSDGRIVFHERPVREWEYMATGTGVTGITANLPAGLMCQVNHNASLDENGRWHCLGRLHLDLDGAPFARATSVHMEHDLRRSSIRAEVETDAGRVTVSIRAHVELDAIRIDIDDGRPQPATLGIRLEQDYAHEDTGAGGAFLTYHVNPTSVYGAINRECGFDMGDEAQDPLLGRAFGLLVALERAQLQATGEPGVFRSGPARRHTLLIFGGARLAGLEALRVDLVQRWQRTLAMGEAEFLRSHEAWWQAFWTRACVEVDDPRGRMVRHLAALDLYRYSVACCASERREFPVRFQNDLFRFSLEDNHWSGLEITAVECYQILYGALRTGDWGALRSQFAAYGRRLPVYRKHSQARFGHAGAIMPYSQNYWGGFHFEPPPTLISRYSEEGNPYSRYSWSGSLWMLWLMCDYVAVSGDRDLLAGVLYPLACEVLTFFRLHYPERESGRAVFFPGEAGETWVAVKNPLELLAAMHVLLPRLLALGEEQGWPAPRLAEWRELLAALPPLPRGWLKFSPARPQARPEVLPGELFVPAEDMSRCTPFNADQPAGVRWAINRQHTELYGVWPAKLTLLDPEERHAALASYEIRLWQHWHDAWALDVVFAACLGLDDEVARWYERHFEYTFTLPGGQAREGGLHHPDYLCIPAYPSMQGLGTATIPVLEMLMQDYPDRLVLLPCWPEDVGVHWALFSPFAGRVEATYKPGQGIEVRTERPIRIELRAEWRGKVGLRVLD